MLVPGKQKYRKVQKGRVAKITKAGEYVAFGEFGLKAIQMERIDSRQIEAARIAANRFLQRNGRLWIRIFPSIPVTKKPIEVRMGKGKGGHDRFVFRVAPGRIIFEIAGVEEKTAKRALELAAGKLPIKTKFVRQHE